MTTAAPNTKFVAAIVVALAIVTQAQVREVRREIVGTASIAGTVIGADAAKAPLRRARVTITGASLIAPRVTVTDDRGRFVMAGLAAGQYTISADKSGYLRMNYGATRPSRLGTAVVLVDGEQAAGLSIALPRGAVIAGTVTNGAGEPEPDVQVTALYWQFRNGERTLVPVTIRPLMTVGSIVLPVSIEVSDFVAVEPPDAARGPADLIQIAEGAVDRAMRGATTGRRAATSGVASNRSGARLFSRNRSTSPCIDRHAGARRRACRCRYSNRARTDGEHHRLGDCGRVCSSRRAGQPAIARAARAELRLRDRWTSWSKTTDAKGHFAFVGVPPGEYRLQASTRSIGGRSDGPSQEPSPRMAFATVEVDGTDHTVDLPLQPGMTMSGRFVFEGGAPPANLAGTQMTLEGLHIDPGRQVSMFRTTLRRTVQFRATGLTPGRFLLRATAPGTTATSGSALKSIVHNARDLLDAPFELAAGEILSGVVVTFTNRPAELTGTLQNSSGTPTADYFILVYSTSRTFWFPNSRRIVSVRPNSSGSYSIRNLPPGEYFLSALADVETGEWFDPEFLRALVVADPIRITIGEGEMKRQDLRVGK